MDLKEKMKDRLKEKIKNQSEFENEKKLYDKRKEIEDEIYGDESIAKKASSVILDDLSTRFSLNSRSKITALFIVIEIVLIYLFHHVFYPLTQLGAMIAKAKPDSFFKSLKIMADSSPFIFAVMLAICFFIGLRAISGLNKNTDNADDRKIEFLGLKAKEHGTAHFMDRKEQQKAFNIVKKDKLKPTDGMIMAENKKGEYICMPWETGRGQDTAPNRNMIIEGPPGTRKSTGVLLPLIYQLLGMGYTCFVTDPKGEILRKTVATALRYGYKIKVLNLRGDQFLNSSGWDCLGTVKRSRVPDETAQDFASIVMQNTETTGSSQKFWYDGELNLCKFLVLYVAHSKNFKPYIGFTDEEYRKLKEKAKMLGSKYELNEDGFLVEGSKELFDSYRNIDQVYAHISTMPIKTLINIVDNLPITDISRKAGMVWLTNKQAIQIVASLATRLQVFQSPLISKLFSTDEINFREMAREKTICYIINSDQSNAYQFLMALFLTFALIEFANIADESKNETLKVPAYFVVEEGKSVGKIPNCATKLSTCRARSINVIFSWQGIPQMQSIYSSAINGREEWQEILACCSTKIFLGAGDPTTAQYISDRFDVGSVSITSKKRTVSIFNPFHLSDRETRDTSEKRRLLMTPGEVTEMAKSKITVSSDSISGVLYLYKAYYLNLPQARDRIYRHDGSQLEVKTGNFYPVWRQVEDIQRSSMAGSVDLALLSPQLEEKDVSEVIKGSEEIVIKRLRKETTLHKLYNIFKHSIDKEEEEYEITDSLNQSSISRDREYDEKHGGSRYMSYDPSKVLAFATDNENGLDPEMQKELAATIGFGSVEEALSGNKEIDSSTAINEVENEDIAKEKEVNDKQVNVDVNKALDAHLETQANSENKDNLVTANEKKVKPPQKKNKEDMAKEALVDGAEVKAQTISLPFKLNAKKKEEQYTPSANASKNKAHIEKLFAQKEGLASTPNQDDGKEANIPAQKISDKFKGKRR